MTGLRLGRGIHFGDEEQYLPETQGPDLRDTSIPAARPLGSQDLLHATQDSAPELFIAWRDCGLLDERGRARPAYDVWKAAFDLPLQE